MENHYERNASARMFENDFLEACSQVHPAVPFVFYIPIILTLLAWAHFTGRTTWGPTLLFIPLGWVTWDLMEYLIHRHFFHWEGRGPWTRKLHDIVHGYHHRFPDDRKRLVMPLGASIPLAIVIGGLLALMGKPAATIPYFCGIVAGYLFYDFTHWSSHYRPPKTAWGRAIRAHHMAHHFACPDRNFGISHRWVDVLVGSLRPRG
jgi:sterol desaturase/sphingolipid hydroxylase (fatty acid hydroxylase superfamily)